MQKLWEDRQEIGEKMFWVGLTDNYIRVAARHEGDLANKITQALLSEASNGLVLAMIVDR